MIQQIIKTFHCLLLIISLNLIGLKSYAQSAEVALASAQTQTTAGKVLHKKTITRNSSNTELNQNEMRKIIQENNLQQEKVRLLSKRQDCQAPLEQEQEGVAPETQERELDRSEKSAGANFNTRIPSDLDEAAVILLVVIGAVVVIYWLTTFPALLAKAANDDGCLMSIRRFFLEHNNYHFSNEYQDAKSTAIEFDFYFKHKFENSIYYGINTLFGQQEISYAQGEHDRRSDKTHFFMIGPSLLFPFFSNDSNRGTSMHMDFLVGWSGKKEIGTLTTARLGLQHTTQSGLYFGTGIGANKFNIDQNQDSFLRDNSQFGMSLYLRAGFEF